MALILGDHETKVANQEIVRNSTTQYDFVRYDMEMMVTVTADENHFYPHINLVTPAP